MIRVPTTLNERKNRIMGKSQVDLLLAYLKSGRSISPTEARTVFGIERLAARILDLRRRGFPIEHIDRVDAKGARYRRYRLVGC